LCFVAFSVAARLACSLTPFIFSHIKEEEKKSGLDTEIR